MCISAIFEIILPITDITDMAISVLIPIPIYILVHLYAMVGCILVGLSWLTVVSDLMLKLECSQYVSILFNG